MLKPLEIVDGLLNVGCFVVFLGKRRLKRTDPDSNCGINESRREGSKGNALLER